MKKSRKKINKPKEKKTKPTKQKSPVKTLRKADMYDKDGKFINKYKPYNGPVVADSTYALFKDPLDRANTKRREEAHRRGQPMYKAKTFIPANGDVKAHYVWVDKFVIAPVKEETKEENTDGGNNKEHAPAEVSGVQGGQNSTESSSETGD